MFTFKSRIRLKYNFSRILLTLFFSECETGSAFQPIDNHSDEKLAVRLPIDAILGQGILESLAPTHQLILVIVIDQ
jgi:hypothetical protein